MSQAGPSSPRLAVGLLRSHVGRRAHDGARLRLAHVIQFPGQTEVRNPEAAVGRQQDVGRLQVAVDDLRLVSRLHGAGQRLDQLRRFLRRQGRAVELLVQRAARAELQAYERQPFVLADLVDLDDISVLQAGDGFGLGLEAGQFGCCPRRVLRPVSS